MGIYRLQIRVEYQAPQVRIVKKYGPEWTVSTAIWGSPALGILGASHSKCAEDTTDVVLNYFGNLPSSLLGWPVAAGLSGACVDDRDLWEIRDIPQGCLASYRKC